jgi:hypothetical protein
MKNKKQFDATMHIHEMMNYEFKMRTDPLINGGYKLIKENHE